MQIGNIVFVREKGIIPSIIRFFDKGRFNHVAIFVSENEILEAEYNTRVKVTEFKYDDYEVISFNLTDEQKNRIVELSKKFIGEQYDFLEIINIWLRICFGITYLSKFNSPKQVICSELVAYFLEDLKLVDKGTELLTPNQLYRYLKKLIK